MGNGTLWPAVGSGVGKCPSPAVRRTRRCRVCTTRSPCPCGSPRSCLLCVSTLFCLPCRLCLTVGEKARRCRRIYVLSCVRGICRIGVSRTVLLGSARTATLTLLGKGVLRRCCGNSRLGICSDCRRYAFVPGRLSATRQLKFTLASLKLVLLFSNTVYFCSCSFAESTLHRYTDRRPDKYCSWRPYRRPG